MFQLCFLTDLDSVEFRLVDTGSVVSDGDPRVLVGGSEGHLGARVGRGVVACGVVEQVLERAVDLRDSEHAQLLQAVEGKLHLRVAVAQTGEDGVELVAEVVSQEPALDVFQEFELFLAGGTVRSR